MRSLTVAYAPDARADLNAIQDWLLEQGASTPTALGHVLGIQARCDRVGLTPFSGRPRPDLQEGARSVSFRRSATIIYRVEPDRVLILRVLRRGRDVEAQFTP